MLRRHQSASHNVYVKVTCNIWAWASLFLESVALDRREETLRIWHFRIPKILVVLEIYQNVPFWLAWDILQKIGACEKAGNVAKDIRFYCHMTRACLRVELCNWPQMCVKRGAYRCSLQALQCQSNYIFALCVLFESHLCKVVLGANKIRLETFFIRLHFRPQNASIPYHDRIQYLTLGIRIIYIFKRTFRHSVAQLL